MASLVLIRAELSQWRCLVRFLTPALSMPNLMQRHCSKLLKVSERSASIKDSQTGHQFKSESSAQMFFDLNLSPAHIFPSAFLLLNLDAKAKIGGAASKPLTMRLPLTLFAIGFVLVVALFQRGTSADTQTAMQPAAHNENEYERHTQAAIRINDLAGRIHSEADAEALVSQIADLFTKELPPVWARGDILQRVAHAEYESVSKPAKVISEQRIADVWNKYVRQIGAPDEAVVTAAEIHNMRDGGFTVAQLMWARGIQHVWTMPNVYALGADGKVADGCRAVEAIRVMHDLDGLFQNLRSARERILKGIVPSEEVKKHREGTNSRPQATARLVARADTNPIRPAEQRFVQEHGSLAYEQLLKRLFDELFPSE